MGILEFVNSEVARIKEDQDYTDLQSDYLTLSSVCQKENMDYGMALRLIQSKEDLEKKLGLRKRPKVAVKTKEWVRHLPLIKKILKPYDVKLTNDMTIEEVFQYHDKKVRLKNLCDVRMLEMDYQEVYRMLKKSNLLEEIPNEIITNKRPYIVEVQKTIVWFIRMKNPKLTEEEVKGKLKGKGSK